MRGPGGPSPDKRDHDADNRPSGDLRSRFSQCTQSLNPRLEIAIARRANVVDFERASLLEPTLRNHLGKALISP
jgi:hypothetical protein